MHFAPPISTRTDSSHPHHVTNFADALDPTAYSHLPADAPQLLIANGGTRAPSLTDAFAIWAPGRPHPPQALIAPRRSEHRKHVGIEALGVREQNLRKVHDIFQLCLLRKDAVRASRALKVLMKAHEFPSGLFVQEGIQLAGLLARQSAFRGQRTDFDDDDDEGADENEWRRGQRSGEQKLEGQKKAAEARAEYLKGLWLRAIRLRPRILPELVRELCILGNYEEALEELQGVTHKYPYRQNPVLHFFSGLLTLVIARPSDIPVALSAEGFAFSALAADADEAAAELSEGREGTRADSDQDGAGDETVMQMSQSSARSRARVPGASGKVLKKRGIALGASAVTVRSIPSSTLANAKQHFRTSIMRAVSSGAAGAGASSETEASASEIGTSGAENGSGAVGYQTDARLEHRVEKRLQEAQRKREAAIRAQARVLALPVNDEKSERAQEQGEEPGSEPQDEDTDGDTTMGSYIPGLHRRKRRRASSADIDEYSSEDEVDPRDRPEPDADEEMQSLLIRQRRMLKAGGEQLESERREEQERLQAERTESLYERDSDEEDEEDGEGQSNKTRSHYWAAQGMWAVELARIYAELIEKEEESRGQVDGLTSSQGQMRRARVSVPTYVRQSQS